MMTSGTVLLLKKILPEVLLDLTQNKKDLTMAPKNIVIIGGGSAGLSCAVQLQKSLTSKEVSITLIEKRSFQFHSIGALRSFVDPSVTDRLFIPLASALPKHGTVLEAMADSIDETSVTIRRMKNGKPSDTTEVLPFDILVLATGSAYPSPIKPPAGVESQAEMTSLINKTAKALKTAKRVLIVGGGSVGCELAGEIATAYPDKTITLLDGNDELIARQNLTSKFRTKLRASLDALNVQVILGDRLEKRLDGHGYEPKTVTTASGREIESDMQFLCGGMTPTVNLIDALDQSLIDNGRSIKVKANCSIDTGNSRLDHVYVIGDASNHPTPKMAYWAGEQGKALGKNLAAWVKKDKPVPAYPAPTTEAIMIPLGPTGGVSQLPMMGGVTVGSTMTKMIKSKDLFLGQSWKAANATFKSSS